MLNIIDIILFIIYKNNLKISYFSNRVKCFYPGRP
jgi:hypothetical protein